MIKRKEFDGKRTVTRIHSLKEFIKPAKEEKKLYSQKKQKTKEDKERDNEFCIYWISLRERGGERKVKNKVSELLKRKMTTIRKKQ